MHIRKACASIIGAIAVVASASSLAEQPRQSPSAAFKDCSEGCPLLIVLGPGTFQMGVSQNEYVQRGNASIINAVPKHRVSIGYKFALGRYDVTRAEFSKFVDQTGYVVADKCWGRNAQQQKRFGEQSGWNWKNPGFTQTERDPVVCVSWDDAQAYITWLSNKTRRAYRLASEAEWEYAARAGATTSSYWSHSQSSACRYANVADQALLNEFGKFRYTFDCKDGYVYTSPVGSFLPNSFGLYDMLGDVQQWTEDCYSENYRHTPADGRAWKGGDCDQHPMRGGSWFQGPQTVGFSDRPSEASAVHMNVTGFRVARDFQ